MYHIAFIIMKSSIVGNDIDVLHRVLYTIIFQQKFNISRYTCIVNLIHYALLTETLEKYRDEVIFAVAEVMSGVPRKWIDTEIIFSTEAKFGTNWGMLTKVKK